jgi:hypothetical protein
LRSTKFSSTLIEILKFFIAASPGRKRHRL